MKGDKIMAKKELSQDELEFQKKLQTAIEQMKDEFNGCPLFNGREKGSLDELEGSQLHIEDLYPIQDYHCVVFEEIKDKFYLTGGALKDLCNNYPPEFVAGRCIEIQPMVETKSRRNFRPIKVLA